MQRIDWRPRGMDRAAETPATPFLTEHSTDAVLRATGVVSLLGVALIHFVQIVDSFKSAVWLGIAFLVLVAAAVAAVLLLIKGSTLAAWATASVVALGPLLGYVVTRSVPTPLDNQDVGNWSEALGLAALFLESSLLALSIYVMATRHRRMSSAGLERAR